MKNSSVGPRPTPSSPTNSARRMPLHGRQQERKVSCERSAVRFCIQPLQSQASSKTQIRTDLSPDLYRFLPCVSSSSAHVSSTLVRFRRSCNATVSMRE